MGESNTSDLMLNNQSLATSEQTQTIAEVQGAIIVAQRCPRNEQRAFVEVVNACKRPRLAEQALYSYPRGGQQVTGPSIRLAEVVARHWGNLQYGIRHVSTEGDSTKFEAFCWDVQTNVRASRIFSQKHGRWTKKKGFQKVDDPRDVYEVVANVAVRRLRACILEIIPGDLVDEAIAACEQTLAGKSDIPLKDRIRKMAQKFDEQGVTEKMLKKFLGHDLEATNEVELISLQKIFISIRDGLGKREDWFDMDKDQAIVDINKRFQDEQQQA